MIQRIVVERVRGVRTHPVTGEVCLIASRQLFYALFLTHRPSWLSFLRDWTRILGCAFRIEYAADAQPEWWIKRSDDPIPWYNETDYIDDLFAILDTNIEWQEEQIEADDDITEWDDPNVADSFSIVSDESY
jgi:hypothetical protein